jgi:magnesium-transporting ATPase (P-type)
MPTQVLREGKFVTVRADEVSVGDILLIKNDETFPADLILLASSSKEASVYI